MGSCLGICTVDSSGLAKELYCFQLLLFFFQIIQIKNTVLISLEGLVVSGIPKNNNQKKPQDNLPIGNLCQLLTTSCDHTVALKTILEQTSSPLYTGMEHRASGRIELVDSSLCSLYGRVDGVNSPSCPCVTCSNMKAISAMLFWKHVATKKPSGRANINIILSNICKSRNINMHWVDPSFLRMEKKSRSFF